jgi:hypothetical protein
LISNKDETFTLIITDVMGKNIHKQKAQLNEGVNTIPLQILQQECIFLQ